jgi:hypothetical protein
MFDTAAVSSFWQLLKLKVGLLSMEYTDEDAVNGGMVIY